MPQMEGRIDSKEDLSSEPDDTAQDTNIIFANRVFIGSGAEAGAWAAELVDRGVSEGAVIVSDQPQGTAPYVRSYLTTTLIDPSLDSARFFSDLPFCSINASNIEVSEVAVADKTDDIITQAKLVNVDDCKIQDLAWYASNGIKVFSGLYLSEAQLDKKELVFSVLTTSPQTTEEDVDLIDTTPVAIQFGQLCIGTGLAPVLIPGPGPKAGWTVDCMMQPIEGESGLSSVYDSETGSVVSVDEGNPLIVDLEVGEGKLEQEVAAVSPMPIQAGHLEVAVPDEYGFGSVHYLSDVGDATKLIYALSKAEEDGQEPVFDPVVVVGAGPRALEVCSALSTHFPDLSLILVLPSMSVLPSIFSSPVASESRNNVVNDMAGSNEGKGGGPCEELSSFYESQLVKRGIKIARGFSVMKLWPSNEEGNYCTLDGPPSNLRPTRPRPFGPAQPQFKQSRGLVLTPTSKVLTEGLSFATDEVRLPARLVIDCSEHAPAVPAALVDAGLRVVPKNNAVFSLNSAECDPSVVVVSSVASSALSSNALIVDSSCRTNHPDIFACGGCAVFALQPALKPPQSRPGTSQSRKSRSRAMEPMLVSHLTSLENASEMARFAANTMVDGNAGTPKSSKRPASSPPLVTADDGADATSSFPFNSPGKFTPVPWLSCSLLELNFKFAGVTLDATPVLVGSTLGYPKFFACIWVRDLRIVGVFLEGGGDQKKQKEALMTMASQRPRIINIKKLKRVSLEALLDNPFCLEPPVMSFKGEFLAELDDDAVFDALRFFDVDGGGVVKTASVGAIMTELGSDWDEDELAEAEAAMDPSGKGFIAYETFRTWWGN